MHLTTVIKEKTRIRKLDGRENEAKYWEDTVRAWW
jgi:hypothetical protein